MPSNAMPCEVSSRARFGAAMFVVMLCCANTLGATEPPSKGAGVDIHKSEIDKVAAAAKHAFSQSPAPSVSVDVTAQISAAVSAVAATVSDGDDRLVDWPEVYEGLETGPWFKDDATGRTAADTGRPTTDHSLGLGAVRTLVKGTFRP